MKRENSCTVLMWNWKRDGKWSMSSWLCSLRVCSGTGILMWWPLRNKYSASQQLQVEKQRKKTHLTSTRVDTTVHDKWDQRQAGVCGCVSRWKIPEISFKSTKTNVMYCRKAKMKNIVYMRELKTTWQSQDQRKKQCRLLYIIPFVFVKLQYACTRNRRAKE